MVELVIKVSDEMYDIIKNQTAYIDEVGKILQDSAHVGVVLPKGHERLIDADKEEPDISNKTKIINTLHRIINTPQQVYLGDYGAER